MTILSKVLAIAILSLGEFLVVYAEMVVAKLPSLHGASTVVFWKIAICMIIGSCALLGGYYSGYKSFQNIWIVTALSIVLVLIVEPVLAYTFFHELPGRGATIGLLLGAMGLFATVLL